MDVIRKKIINVDLKNEYINFLEFKLLLILDELHIFVFHLFRKRQIFIKATSLCGAGRFFLLFYAISV